MLLLVRDLAYAILLTGREYLASRAKSYVERGGIYAVRYSAIRSLLRD